MKRKRPEPDEEKRDAKRSRGSTKWKTLLRDTEKGWWVGQQRGNFTNQTLDVWFATAATRCDWKQPGVYGTQVPYYFAWYFSLGYLVLCRCHNTHTL